MNEKRTARIDGGLAENADVYFEIASLSKTLFAHCVISLAKDGVIDLERPLCQYAPECFLSSDPRARHITAKDVLRHSSGLLNWEKQRDKTICFEPGLDFQYSGEGYAYLQSCIYSAFSLTFQELLNRYVNAPLGTHIAGNYTAIPAAMPFVYPNASQKPYAPIREENAAYSVYATARDYAMFLDMAFADGAADMTASSITVNADTRWCMGFGLLAQRYAFQYGDNGDYQALYYVDIPVRRVRLWLSNYRYGLMDAVSEINQHDVKCGITAFLKQQYGAAYSGLTAHGSSTFVSCCAMAPRL